MTLLGVLPPGRVRRSPPRPFALAPLMAAVGDPNQMEMARLLGVHGRQIHRWGLSGLTELQADRAAIALGLHPAEVWPHWWIAAEDNEQIGAA